MFENLKNYIKDLYLKISFVFCCRSKCQIQIGREEENNNNNTNNTDTNTNNNTISSNI